MNLVQDLVDSHLLRGDGDEIALLSMGDGGSVESATFRELAVLSNRAAYALRGVGVVPGDRVYIARALDELTVCALFGVLRNGAIAILGEPGVSLTAAEADGTVVAITDDPLDRAAFPSVREVMSSSDLMSRMDSSRDVFRSTECAADTPAIALVDGPEVLREIRAEGNAGDPAEVTSSGDANGASPGRYFLHGHGIAQRVREVAERWLAPSVGESRPTAIASEVATGGGLLALFALLSVRVPVLLPGRPRDPLSWWQAAGPAAPSAVVGDPDYLDALPPTADLERVRYSSVAGGGGAVGDARSLLNSLDGVPFADTDLASVGRLDGQASP